MSDPESRCVRCKQPFTELNVYSEAGWREISISGLCEECFDEIIEFGDEPQETEDELFDEVPF